MGNDSNPNETCKGRSERHGSYYRFTNVGNLFGLCLLHVSPEAAVGGPLALIENGDIIELDVENCSVNVRLSDAELAQRRIRWKGFTTEHMRGWPLLYQRSVLQPNLGCDLDFLCAPTAEHRQFVPPVVGRS